MSWEKLKQHSIYDTRKDKRSRKAKRHRRGYKQFKSQLGNEVSYKVSKTKKNCSDVKKICIQCAKNTCDNNDVKRCKECLDKEQS